MRAMSEHLSEIEIESLVDPKLLREVMVLTK